MSLLYFSILYDIILFTELITVQLYKYILFKYLFTFIISIKEDNIKKIDIRNISNSFFHFLYWKNYPYGFCRQLQYITCNIISLYILLLSILYWSIKLWYEWVYGRLVISICRQSELHIISFVSFYTVNGFVNNWYFSCDYICRTLIKAKPPAEFRARR